MFYFAFEYINCRLFDWKFVEQCENAGYSSFGLSMFIVVGYFYSCVTHSVSVKIRMEARLTKTKLARMDLSTAQWAQFIFFSIASLCTFYLLASIGVPTSINHAKTVVTVGLFSYAVILGLEVSELQKYFAKEKTETLTEEGATTEVEMSNPATGDLQKEWSKRRVSLSAFQDGIRKGAIV